MDNIDKIECQICKKIFSKLGLPSHLHRIHSISVREYYDKFMKKANEGKCLTCGKDTNFISITKGYRRFCCVSCGNNNEEIKQQIKETNIRLHNGVSNGRDKESLEKYKETSIKNWGVDNPSKNEEIKKKNLESHIKHFGKHYLSTKECRNKGKAKLKVLYDVEYYMQSDDFYEKCQETWQETYGVTNPFQLESVRKKAIEVHKENAKNHTSKFEREIFEYLKENIPDEIIHNDYDTIFPYELDIYIPSIKMGIECNGTYYHSILHDNVIDRILNKSLLCREKNIRLIHIYEFENINLQKELLYDLIVNKRDRYDSKDFNKNNLIENIPEPEIIYNDGRLIIYGAGKLYKESNK